MQLRGKNVVYIGGCGGIGAATCKLLLRRGITNLAILDLTENLELIRELKHQSPSVNVFFLKLDIANKDSVVKSLKDVTSKMGHFDVLVNGSGIFDDLNPRRAIDVNLLGVIYSTLAALDLMDKSKGGRGGTIINIGSVAGLDPFVQAPVYSASKAGVVMFTRNLGDEFHYRRTGVSLIALCPGVTDTNIVDHFKEDERCQHVSAIRMMLGVVKIQKPEDCAVHIVEAIELDKSGAVYVSYDGQMREVPIQSWYKAAKM